MSSIPVKLLSKVQNVLWNYGTVQIWPYLGAGKCWGHSVLQTPALVIGSLKFHKYFKSLILISVVPNRNLGQPANCLTIFCNLFNMCCDFLISFCNAIIKQWSVLLLFQNRNKWRYIWSFITFSFYICLMAIPCIRCNAHSMFLLFPENRKSIP